MKHDPCAFEHEGTSCSQSGLHSTHETAIKKKGYYCTNCGEKIRGKICLKCGAKNKTTKYCYYCGTPMKEHAAICVNCHETTRNNILTRTLAIISLALTLIWFVMLNGNVQHNYMALLAAALMLFLALPFGDNLIKKLTHTKRRLRAPMYIFTFVLALILSFTPVFLEAKSESENDKPKQASQNTLADYTYDECVMYSAMTKGYTKVLNSLKNPKTADFLGISYDPESEMVYFCVIAENSFGGNTKCYIAYSDRYDRIDEGSDRQYYYESAEIKRTMDDLFTFIEAASNSDNDDIPTPTTNEKLAEYSYEEQVMFEKFIEGIDWINTLYDDVMIFYCKYNTETGDAYFEFSGTEKYSNTVIVSYAWYSNALGLEVGEWYKDDFENADATYYDFEVDDYREAKEKDISQ